MKTKILTIVYLALCPVLIVLGAIINAVIHSAAYVIDSIYSLCHIKTSYNAIKASFEYQMSDIFEGRYFEKRDAYKKAFIDYYPLLQRSLSKKIYDFQKEVYDLSDELFLEDKIEHMLEDVKHNQP